MLPLSANMLNNRKICVCQTDKRSFFINLYVYFQRSTMSQRDGKASFARSRSVGLSAPNAFLIARYVIVAVFPARGERLPTVQHAVL